MSVYVCPDCGVCHECGAGMLGLATGSLLPVQHPRHVDRCAYAVAAARQEIAHEGAGNVPPWRGLTAYERADAVTEARHWLAALARVEQTQGGAR